MKKIHLTVEDIEHAIEEYLKIHYPDYTIDEFDFDIKSEFVETGIGGYDRIIFNGADIKVS